MNNDELTQAEAIQQAGRRIACAISPSDAVGATDATGGYVMSLSEAMMGITAALSDIALSISELADAVRDIRED